MAVVRATRRAGCNGARQSIACAPHISSIASTCHSPRVMPSATSARTERNIADPFIGPSLSSSASWRTVHRPSWTASAARPAAR